MPPKPAPVLSDEGWQAIREAVGTLPGGADLKEARRRLESSIAEYHGLSLPRSKVAKLKGQRERFERYRKIAAKLRGTLIAERWLFFDKGLETLCACLKGAAEGRGMLARAHKGKSDPAIDWLYWRLFQIWTDHLGGTLGTSKGTKTGGPLIRFICAAFALVGKAPPRKSTIAKRAENEAEDRKQWREQLERYRASINQKALISPDRDW
jgi:hypothetical protein